MLTSLETREERMANLLRRFFEEEADAVRSTETPLVRIEGSFDLDAMAKFLMENSI